MRSAHLNLHSFSPFNVTAKREVLKRIDDVVSVGRKANMNIYLLICPGCGQLKLARPQKNDEC